MLIPSHSNLPKEIIEKVIREVDSNNGEIVDFLSKLIKFKTASQNPSDEFYPTGIKNCMVMWM